MGWGDGYNLPPFTPPFRGAAEWPIIAKSFKINRDENHSPNFHFAVFLSHAIFALGMNLSLAAKRMTTSTSSIISTTTKSITANGEARN
jgi:hypothetical protein